MKIALFGGSFDPPHSGHMEVVKAALDTLEIDRLIIVPAFQNPFKQGTHATGAQRLEWLKEMFGPFEKVEISDYEISKNRPVYTIETVEYFGNTADTVYVIIGADNLSGLPGWHRFDDLNRKVRWVVAKRGDITIPEGMAVLEVHSPISSTECRTLGSSTGLPGETDSRILNVYKETNEPEN